MRAVVHGRRAISADFEYQLKSLYFLQNAFSVPVLLKASCITQAIDANCVIRHTMCLQGFPRDWIRVTKMAVACPNTLPELQAPEPQLPWYAVRVRSNAEKIVHEALVRKQYDSFLPTYRSRLAGPTALRNSTRPCSPDTRSVVLKPQSGFRSSLPPESFPSSPQARVPSQWTSGLLRSGSRFGKSRFPG